MLSIIDAKQVMVTPHGFLLQKLFLSYLRLPRHNVTSLAVYKNQRIHVSERNDMEIISRYTVDVMNVTSSRVSIVPTTFNCVYS